jgi:hypothetical protein
MRRDLERDSALRSITDQVEYLKSELGYGRTKLRRTGSADARIRAGGGGGGGGAGPSDPTGGSVDAASTQAERNEERMAGWDESIAHALDLLAKVALDVDKVLRPPAEAAPQQLPMKGCVSCARDDGHFSEIHERFADIAMCYPCGSFKKSEGRMLPVPTVEELHRTGRRLTTKMISEGLRAEQLRALENAPKSRRRSA